MPSEVSLQIAARMLAREANTSTKVLNPHRAQCRAKDWSVSDALESVPQHVCFRGIRVCDLITPISGPMVIEPTAWATHLVNQIAMRIESSAKIGMSLPEQCKTLPGLFHEVIEHELLTFEQMLVSNTTSDEIDLSKLKISGFSE